MRKKADRQLCTDMRQSKERQEERASERARETEGAGDMEEKEGGRGCERDWEENEGVWVGKGGSEGVRDGEEGNTDQK